MDIWTLVIVSLVPTFGWCSGREYLVEVKEGWIEEIKETSLKFGLQFERQVLSNVYLFKKVPRRKTRRHAADSTLDKFKDHFDEKILRIEIRTHVQVRYVPLTEMFSSSPNPGFKEIIERKQKPNVTLDSCWPYYGMGVQQAWALGYTGKGVTVAVVDNGVDIQHPDLIRNIDKKLSHNFVRDDDDLTPQHFFDYHETEDVTSHGSLVAGLIAGEFGNDDCSAGIAYNSTLSVLKVFETKEKPYVWMWKMFPYSGDFLSLALSYKNKDIDVYSCSFNIGNTFQQHGMDVQIAISEGVTKGRKGKGNIYVSSAGNRQTMTDCNSEAFATSVDTLTISSVGINGSIPEFAIPCAAALASTYGEFVKFVGHKRLESTRQDGRCGNFLGTSASAAIASAMIALTLQANPSLTWRDVQYIVVLSSSLERLNTDSSQDTNGAGFKYSHFHGFGLMNATSMVLLSKTWRQMPPQLVQAVPATGAYQTSFHPRHFWVKTVENTCSKSCVNYLEYVSVDLHYKTNVEGLVQILACSPLRTCSFVYHINIHLESERTMVERSWNFTSSHFWGENPKGTWLIVLVVNTASLGQGYLLQWLKASLVFYGPAENPYPENFPLADSESQKNFTVFDSEINTFLSNVTNSAIPLPNPKNKMPEEKQYSMIEFSWPGTVLFTVTFMAFSGCSIYHIITKFKNAEK